MLGHAQNRCNTQYTQQEPRHGIPEALDEARMVMVGAVSDLLEKTGEGALNHQLFLPLHL